MRPLATSTEPPRRDVAGIVLAAGLSTRMGVLKQLLPIAGKPMVARATEVLVSAGVADIVVVVGHERSAVESALTGLPVRAVFNPDYAVGEMFSSVQTGLRALTAGADAALIALGDQPFLAPQTVRALVTAYAVESTAAYAVESTAAYAGRATAIVQPQFGNRRGHPIILGRAVWAAVLEAAPGTTLRDIVRRHDAMRRFVPVNDPQILVDLNRPEDLHRARNPHSARPPAH